MLGPEDLSFEDMARIMFEAMVQGMADMMTAMDRGLDNAEPRTPYGTAMSRAGTSICTLR